MNPHHPRDPRAINSKYKESSGSPEPVPRKKHLESGEQYIAEKKRHDETHYVFAVEERVKDQHAEVNEQLEARRAHVIPDERLRIAFRSGDQTPMKRRRQ